MRHLLNTLFVTTEDCYLTLEGENVVVLREEKTLGRFPLHSLEGILCFTYKGASPALMGACAQRNVMLSFMRPTGRFLARVAGETVGNVLLRKAQYRISEDVALSLPIAKSFILGKVYNCRWVLERATRDHPMRVDVERLKGASGLLYNHLPMIDAADNHDTLRGLEGECALRYFGVLDELILRDKESFYFTARTRRPPLDNVNAILSFFYTVLSNDCASALESVGLDPYVGFMHTDKPGRASLALDLMEELRSILVDRFTITMINNRVLTPEYFDEQESGAVMLTEDGRKAAISAWQDKKRDVIEHPFLKEKIPWGLVPYVQALLLARCIRGDLDAYPPFMWK